MNNCESERRRSKIKIARNAEQVLNVVSKFVFDRYMIFGENMAVLTTRQKSIFWDTLTIVEATILDLAKYHMYYFHYRVIRPNFNCLLLYSDTDSLLYSVQIPDFYKELSKKPQSVLSHFGFSNYPSDQFSFNASKLVVKINDEFAGDYITKFICLKTKLCSILSTSRFILFEINNISLTINTCSWLVTIWKMLVPIVII